MALLEPFRALRATPSRAAEVAAPPYDVLDTEEARALTAGKPYSFLHVSKPEIDFPSGTDPHSEPVHTRGRANLDRLVADGLLVRDAEACFYLYRVVMGDHSQLGLVGSASIEAYRSGRMKLHENTTPEKVADRARNADALDAHTGTLFLTHLADAAVDGRMARLAAAEPAIEVTGEDGVRHSIWVVDEAEEISAFRAAFEAMPAIYMADGHHRSAAADQLARRRTEARARGEQVGAADRFLAVAFPDDQVRILPYNRVVSSIGDRTAAQFVDELSGPFRVETSAEPVEPEAAGVFGLYVDGRWHRLTIDPQLVPTDPVERLDINLLTAHCLEPLLGIVDQQTDPRIDFVGGIRGVAELERRVDGGATAAAFTLEATRLSDVLTVADAGQVMPTKSTWFEPKLRDGLLVLPLSG